MREIPKWRLGAQHLARPSLAPVALVGAFGAIQAQEYEHAKWAVGLRAPGTTEADIETQLVRGDILRTHPMRGTHHLVARTDMRWLMTLMGPLMIARSARRNRELELDEKTLSRCMRVIDRAVTGGHHLTRAEVASALARARISTAGQRLPHIIYRAELEALVCSGARKGKQITIAAFEERVGDAPRPSREDSLRELATRYFTTRGPATLKDFMWWCQLPAADARAALELARPAPVARTDCFALGGSIRATPPRALLLPPFDEYTVAYADRTQVLQTPATRALTPVERSLLGPILVLDGTAVASWRRSKAGRRDVQIQLAPWTALTAADRRAIDEAAQRYAAFVGVDSARVTFR